MTRQVNVFETFANKWVKISTDNGGEVLYTSDKNAATVFSIPELMAAHKLFTDFYHYKRTMHAVPLNSNNNVHECDTVEYFLKDNWDNVMPSEPEEG